MALKGLEREARRESDWRRERDPADGFGHRDLRPMKHQDRSGKANKGPRLPRDDDGFVRHGFETREALSLHSKPPGCPPGTLPINRTGWLSTDIHLVKHHIGAGPTTWVGVSPDGHVWTAGPDGRAEDWGHWENLK